MIRKGFGSLILIGDQEKMQQQGVIISTEEREENIMAKMNVQLPDHSKERQLTLIQARVDTELVNKVNRIREARNITWTELIAAMLQAVVDDQKAGK